MSLPTLARSPKTSLTARARPDSTTAQRVGETLALHPLEGQVIRLSLSEIKKKISARLTDPEGWEKGLENLLENCFREHGGYHERVASQPQGSIAYTDELQSQYPATLREVYYALVNSCPTWNDDTTWAGWYPKNPTDAKDSAGNTFKYYATPSAAPDQIPAFVAAFPDLVARLEKKADGKMIGTKIPTLFTGFLGLNDRLVVHFYDAQLREIIAETVKTWASDHKIRLAVRSHEFGIDRESGDTPMMSDPSQQHESTDAGSFTQRLARKFARAVAELADFGGYTDDQLTQWTIDLVRRNLCDAKF